MDELQGSFLWQSWSGSFWGAGAASSADASCYGGSNSSSVAGGRRGAARACSEVFEQTHTHTRTLLPPMGDLDQS